MDSETLKACPFCGGVAERVDVEEGENAGGSWIGCTSCLACSNVEFGDKENFVSNWNRRATPPEPAPVADAASLIKSAILGNIGYEPHPWDIQREGTYTGIDKAVAEIVQLTSAAAPSPPPRASDADVTALVEGIAREIDAKADAIDDHNSAGTRGEHRREAGMDSDTRKLLEEIRDACLFVDGGLLGRINAALRSASPAARDAEAVAEAMENSGGYWQPCSGCHETEDGQNVHGYPRSPVYQCIVGSGCTECGGIGVIWEGRPMTDDEARAIANSSASAALSRIPGGEAS